MFSLKINKIFIDLLLLLVTFSLIQIKRVKKTQNYIIYTDINNLIIIYKIIYIYVCIFYIYIITHTSFNR